MSDAVDNNTPVRYQIAETDRGRALVCSNASNLQLHVETGLSVDAAGRRNFDSQSIFLDGVYTEAPFLDNKKRQYSLDHHAGCVRALTLATCEQTAVMLLNGLPLDEGNWRIYINDPDIDALLAAWLLMNHREMLRDERELLSTVMPLVRIEGVIDAHGLDKEVLTGLPNDVYEGNKQHLDELLAREREAKRDEGWGDTDLLEYTREGLAYLDSIFLTDSYLSHLMEVAEIASRPVQGSRIAVLCRSGQGIYEVEMALRERYGRQLAIIVLVRGRGRYTLRLVDRFLHADLRDAYHALNRADPNGKARDGNEWGGSDDIGGSPRRNGSALPPEKVLDIVYDACRHRGPLQRITYALGRLAGMGSGTKRRRRSNDGQDTD